MDIFSTHEDIMIIKSGFSGLTIVHKEWIKMGKMCLSITRFYAEL